MQGTSHALFNCKAVYSGKCIVRLTMSLWGHLSTRAQYLTVHQVPGVASSTTQRRGTPWMCEPLPAYHATLLYGETVLTESMTQQTETNYCNCC